MKLTPEDVLAIKILLDQGGITRVEIARQFNISRGTIVDIASGRIWRHVIPGEYPSCDIIREKVPRRRGENNILIIGDLHQPFCLDGYLDFCQEQKERFKCRTIVFIGDIIDNHYPSYHETDPDGLSGADELGVAIGRLKPWIDAFPKAHITLGNHDRMVMRKAFSGGIPRAWIKSFCEVLDSPSWEFVDEVVIDNVQYIHGEGGTARVKARNDKFSTVQGHLHTHAYVESMVGRNTCVFGMQVGCGIDRRAYAMAYAKTGPKPAIGCGVVLNQGNLAIQIMADLTEERFKNNQLIEDNC